MWRRTIYQLRVLQEAHWIAQTHKDAATEAFTVRDLRERTGELIRGAEDGHLSVVTKHGNPVFVAVPFDEVLLERRHAHTGTSRQGGRCRRRDLH